MSDTVTLSIKSITGAGEAKGYLHVYRELDYSEIETEVVIEFDVQPYEKETLESPRVDASIEIIMVKSGDVEFNLDAIDNLREAGDEILTMPVDEPIPKLHRSSLTYKNWSE